MLNKSESSAELNSSWEIIDEIPLDISKGTFTSSQKSFILVDK
jgi:hypothetical protein